MVVILYFRIFFKNAKHKNPGISKTVLDRAISTKFLTHRVLLSSWSSFLRKISPIRNGGHFEFSNILLCKRSSSYVHPTGGGGGVGVDILFLLFPPSAARSPASGCLVSAHFKEKYLSYFYQIWCRVYWVNSLHGIAFSEDSSIVNWVIAT